jgi:signal transduction histidine kinase
MLHSIRRRLPLSYAAIALLAALALGAVLLLILRSYYLRVERDYLRGNAQAIGFSLASLIEDDQPAEVLQARLDSFSFLSGTRVRIFDPEGQVVASSNLPGDYRVAFASALVGEPRAPLPDGRSVIVIRPGELASATLTTTRSIPWPPLVGLERRLAGVEPVRGIAPFVLQTQTPTSGQVVQCPIYDTGNQLLGYVELSQGPAYAREIVGDVAWGWGIASAVAVILAAAAGWLVSRRISAPLLALTDVTASMADGDLSARADVRRKDEFGTLARSFNTMANQVEDTVVTLRRFVSDAAHELNTPLATLRTTLEMMRDDIAPGDGVSEDGAPGSGARQDTMATLSARLARAQTQVERLEVLTRGMLDLSRIEAGTSPGTFGPVSLTMLAQEMSELYASCAEQAELDFELCLPETPIIIQGDKTQLQQALANLLDNAIKFTPAGGRVALGLDQVEGAASLWVEDTGIGVPEEDLPHLFQRFHRGRNTEGYPGSGLGLVIVKAIANEHGGQVNVETRAKGSRFTVRLPLEDYSPASALCKTLRSAAAHSCGISM